MIKYTEKEFKSILNKRKFIDSWFWDRYSINAYNGCQFGCIYCDSRSAHYRMPTDFENNVIVKKNVGEMLDKRISNARSLLPDVVGMSGVTDPYQPAENQYRNTRQCLEVLQKHKYPVHIATKSKLVLQDLEILEKIGTDTWCCVSVTITTTQTEIAKFLEERIPPPPDRFKIINTIKLQAKHIQTGVLFIPIVPFLCDSDEDLESMVKTAKESGADYLLFGAGMTMRDLQSIWFMSHLYNKFPGLVELYEKLYRFKYNKDTYAGMYEPGQQYSQELNRKMLSLCEKFNLQYRIKRYIPEGFRKSNYIISEKLLNRSYQLQIMGKNWKNIYWAGMNIQNLKESIADVATRNELRKIRNVSSDIENFIREQLLNYL